MVIHSVPIMTMFDVFIVGVTIFAIFNYVSKYKELNELKFVGAVGLIILGLVVLSVTYLLDFLTMHIFPMFMSFDKADAIMNVLYMNWNWWIAATGVCIIVCGVAYLSRYLVPQTEKLLSELKRQKSELNQALDHQKKLESELRTLKDQLEEKSIERAVGLERSNRDLEDALVEIASLKEQLDSMLTHHKNNGRPNSK